ncbi:DUF411 domain-containing protein [soil metagenome]
MAGRMFVLAAALVLGACGGNDSQAQRVALAGAVSADTIVVYKTPTCGCCNAWVDHVRANGFTVVTHDLNDLSEKKRELGVPAGQISCHTAQVRGYTLEGHVPADLIHRMLDENARFKGLTVPGMPMGSPGMEGLIKQDYQVLSFDESGRTSVYAER